MTSKAVFGCVLVAAVAGVSFGSEPAARSHGRDEGRALFAEYVQAGSEVMRTVGIYAQLGKTWMSAGEGFTDKQLQEFLAARRAFFAAEQKSLNAVLAYKRYVDAAATEAERNRRLATWEHLNREWGEALADANGDGRNAP